MTMMAHIRSVVEGLTNSEKRPGAVYFGSFVKPFDKVRLSDDQEVLIMSVDNGPELAVRIASIDAIELHKV